MIFPLFSHCFSHVFPIRIPHGFATPRGSRRQGLDLASNALDDDASFEDLEQLRFLVSWTTAEPYEDLAAMNGYNGRMGYMIY
jgi:hypothetical protein